LFIDNDVRSFVTVRMPLAKASRNAGFDVHVACPAGDAAKYLAREGFPFHPIPLSRSGMDPFAELAALAALYRLCKRIQPDLVHLLRLKLVLYGGLAARFAGIHAVASELTGLGYLFADNHWTTRCLRRLVTLASRLALAHANQSVIYHNSDDRDLFVRARVLPIEKTFLISGSGVDTDRFSPRPEPAGPPVVLLASRMLWDKGVGEFVEAARMVRHAGSHARFVLVGNTDPGNPSAIPAEHLSKWRQEGVIEWWGHRTNMPDVFHQAHVVCLPSIREGLPRVLIEAASCGKPLITTDAPGCRDVVRNGDNGVVVPVRDAQSLAWAFRLLLENAVLRRSMGARSRERAVREFARDHFISRILALYSSLLATRPVPLPAPAPVFSLASPLALAGQLYPPPFEARISSQGARWYARLRTGLSRGSPAT
jgi:glycosyltransferase involved in cell wall biosynthesis